MQTSSRRPCWWNVHNNEELITAIKPASTSSVAETKPSKSPTTFSALTVSLKKSSKTSKPLSNKSALISTLPVYDIFQRQAFQVTSQVFTE